MNGKSADAAALSYDDDHVAVSTVDLVEVSTRRLDRSVRFYMRVFGFGVVEEAREAGASRVLMKGGAGVYLALRKLHGPPEARDARPLHCSKRWSFVVGDLDRAREAMWNLGVSAADGTDVPRRVHSWRRSRSFTIKDPDGNEIELVEADAPAREARAASPRETADAHRVL